MRYWMVLGFFGGLVSPLSIPSWNFSQISTLLRPRASPCRKIDGCEPCARFAELVREATAEKRHPQGPVVVRQVTLAYDCLKSIPFNTEVGLQSVQAARNVAEFISYSGFLKDESFTEKYKVPRVDILHLLRRLEERVSNGLYTFEWDFEWDLRQIFMTPGDTHTEFKGRLLHKSIQFSRDVQSSILSFAQDGDQPKIYLEADVQRGPPFRDGIEIKNVNDRDVIAYLSQIAYTQPGFDSHTKWNNLFPDNEGRTDGRFSYCELSAVPPDGMDFTTFTKVNGDVVKHANSVEIDDPETWHSINGPDSAFLHLVKIPGYADMNKQYGDNQMEEDEEQVGEQQADEDPSRSDDEMEDSGAMSTLYNSVQWQVLMTGEEDGKPVVCFGGGFFPMDPDSLDEQIAVIHIGSLGPGCDAMEQSKTMANFIFSCNHNQVPAVSKLIVDMRRNPGGSSLNVDFTVFNLLPDVKTKSPLGFRKHKAAELMGQVMETANFGQKFFLDGVYDFEDASGHEIMTWEDMYQTRQIGDDLYTRTIFESGEPASETRKPFFRGTQLTILSDGACASACAEVLARLLRSERYADARIVTVGGRPDTTGPMTPTGETSGNRMHYLDEILDAADYVDDTLRKYLREDGRDDEIPMWDAVKPSWPVAAADMLINVSDNFWDDDATIPTQFRPLKSHCRIWPAWEHFLDPTSLYRDVYNVVWGGKAGDGKNFQDLCVKDSNTLKGSPIDFAP